jgi:hypothetical protein
MLDSICTQNQVEGASLHLVPKDVQMQVIQPSDLLTAAELADCLGVKPGTILGWHRSGRIPGRRLSHKVLRFSLAAVLAALEGRQEAAGQGGDL